MAPVSNIVTYSILAVAGIAVFLTEFDGIFKIVTSLVIVALAVIWKWQNGNLEERRHVGEKKAQLSQLREEIRQYTPGTWTRRPFPPGFLAPRELKIGVFGAQDSGKSTWLNSSLFAFTGSWEEVLTEGDPRFNQGGETILREPVRLTDDVTLVDNRGMLDLDLKNVDKILDEIHGRRGLDPTVPVTEGMAIDCPVFVFKYSQTTGTQHANEFVHKFVDSIRKELGNYPIMVITFGAGIQNASAMKDIFVMAGMARHSIFTIENYTVSDHEEDIDKHIELLKLLKICIRRGDDNLIYRQVKGSEKVVQEKKSVTERISDTVRSNPDTDSPQPRCVVM